MRNAMMPPSSETAVQYAASIVFPKPEPIKGTWSAMVQTSVETVRPRGK